MGVQFFGGLFYKCVDSGGTILSATIVPDRNACIALNYQWMNSNANFDNALNGFLALLEVVSAFSLRPAMSSLNIFHFHFISFFNIYTG